ncbi:MAG: hypothetical protein V1668_00305 [Patescibacteria group bacterium]
MPKNAQVPGYPGYIVKSDMIIHKRTGFIAGVKRDRSWVSKDDEGGVIVAPTPADLIASNKAATRSYDRKYGF